MILSQLNMTPIKINVTKFIVCKGFVLGLFCRVLLHVLVFVLDPCFVVWFLISLCLLLVLVCRVVLGVRFSLVIFSLSVLCFSSLRCHACADPESFVIGGPKEQMLHFP